MRGRGVEARTGRGEGLDLSCWMVGVPRKTGAGVGEGELLNGLRVGELAGVGLAPKGLRVGKAVGVGLAPKGVGLTPNGAGVGLLPKGVGEGLAPNEG